MPAKTFPILFAAILFANFSCVFAQRVTTPVKKESDVSAFKPNSRYIHANGIRIHYLEWNHNAVSTIILLHGLNDDATVWSALAPLLAHDYHVIALDRRGAGLTSKSNAGYDFQTLAKDVLSVIDKLNLQRVRLVGHSAGAGVALMASVIEPEKIDSVVLIDGGFWAKKTNSSATKTNPPCNIEPIDCKRSLAIQRGAMDYDAESLYTRVSVPTLLIMGYPPKAEAEQFARELQEAQAHVEQVAYEKLRTGKMAIIRETSHWIQRDQPNELAMAIRSFYNKAQ